mgnify:CR=1 FL=1
MMLIEDLKTLTNHHIANSSLYRNYINTFFPKIINNIVDLKDVPFVPVRAFKEFKMKSIKDEYIYKTMTSSGTSGSYSKIFLDKETANLQTAKLIDIFKNTFGNSRFPMIVIDSESVVKNRLQFSARTAAINGFSIFSRRRVFALDDDYKLNLNKVKEFMEKNNGQKFFIFGFTFMIWEYFIKELIRSGQEIDLSNAFILHGGGWKKLINEKVSNEEFKKIISNKIKCNDVRNYYGMVEQTGSIFMECPFGSLHASNGSDILIRDKRDLSAIGHDQEGVIQVFSNLQKSYPGHSILTEDIGFTSSGASCPCDNNNTIINIIGRLQSAEVRGCSDAYS